MAVFTAFVAVVLRWCNAPEAVFQFVMDGRADPRVENTIGYFAAPLLLRLELRKTDRLRDLMERIVAQYVEAHQHADFSYIESQAPRPDFTCNSIFNWIAQEQRFDRAPVTRNDAVTSDPFRFENPMLRNFERDNEPAMLLVDYGNEIAGHLQFRRDRHSARSMQAVGRQFLSCIEQFGAEQG
jgi:non-ribosomal peptide synthetase component F